MPNKIENKDGGNVPVQFQTMRRLEEVPPRVPENPPETKAEHKRPNKKPSKRLRNTGIVLAVLIVAAFTVFQSLKLLLGPVRLSNISDAFKSASAHTKGLPATYLGDMLVFSGKLGDDIALVDKTGAVRIYGTNGALSTIQLGYSEPDAVANNGRLLVFDRVGGEFALLSRFGVLWHGTNKTDILCADLHKDGSIALAAKGTGGASQFVVYDPAQKQVSSGSFADEYATAIAFSKNGRSIFIALEGAIAAKNYARLVEYATENTETPVFDNTIDHAWVYKLSVIQNGVLAFGDNAVYTIAEDGKFRTEAYAERTPIDFASSANGSFSAVLLQDFGVGALLRFYNKSGEKTVEFTKEAASRVFCDGNKIYSFSGNKLIKYNAENASKSQTINGEVLAVKGNKAYILNEDRVSREKLVWAK